jgi:hypothetical protein
MYRSEHESLMALLHPLFITSFLIDDFLADNAFFQARTALISSASSKTAYGLGYCLARRRGQPGVPRLVGLTSAANLAFTRSLGCYDEVVAYDDVTALPAGQRAVYVDISGDAALRARIHGHFGANLGYSCSVGGTHWQALGSGHGLPGCASGAVLRAGADQEAGRRLGRDRAAAADGGGLAKIHRACR